MDTRSPGSSGTGIMSSWTERLHRRSATLGTVLTACAHPTVPYPRRIEKVKFGVPLQEVFKNDIPGPLLVLILKLNKEGPYKKDVFRAPGHQGNMKKLVHFLQNGRLVNIDNFSVYTIASVLKKFLRKLPDGIFGREGEQELFQILEMTSIDEQRDHIHSIISSLPLSTQRLIVLLFGTFRAIASNCDRSQTGMTSEALGVSVAPSFFQSCVSDGKQAKMEDVLRFKLATKIMKFLIDNFGVSNLFGRENYEYYARITGRILKVEEDWIFSFRYPPDGIVSRQMSLDAERSWLQFESERWGLKFNLEAMSQQEESQSTPALIQASDRLEAEEGEPCSSLTSIPENNLLESYTRLSVSLEDNGLFKDMIEGASRSSNNLHMTLDELRAVNHYAESTKSLTFLPQQDQFTYSLCKGTEVHERQAARMAARSEWFLAPSQSSTTVSKIPLLDAEQEASMSQYYILREESMANRTGPGPGSMFSTSAESLKQLVRRSSSKEKERRLIRRSSSKKNKENGASTSSNKAKDKTTSSPSSQQAPSIIALDPATASTDAVGSDPPASAQIEDADPAPEVPDSTASTVEKVSTPKKSPTSIPASPRATTIDLRPTAEPDEAELTVKETDCTETTVQTFHVTLTYKPRI